MEGITEPARHALYSRLIEILGSDEATTLMSHLPPIGWADVATVHTQQQLADQLRAEMGELRGQLGELRGEFGELRGEFGALRGEFGALRGEVDAGLAAVRAELHDGMRRQTYALVGAMVTISGIVAAAASLG